MVLVVGSFAMPAPSARKVLLVINVSAHAETAGEEMGPTVPVCCEQLGNNRKQPQTIFFWDHTLQNTFHESRSNPDLNLDINFKGIFRIPLSLVKTTFKFESLAFRISHKREYRAEHYQCH